MRNLIEINVVQRRVILDLTRPHRRTHSGRRKICTNIYNVYLRTATVESFGGAENRGSAHAHASRRALAAAKQIDRKSASFRIPFDQSAALEINM